MNSIQILDALKSKDLNSIKAFSEYAVREKQEAFIPVLIYCLNISTDSLIKRNLLRLMSLFNKKYLSHIEIFIQDEDQIVSELATEIVQSIKAMPKILEPKLNEDLDNTAANNLYNALNQDSVDDLARLISQYKSDLENWNEVQSQEVIDFIIPRVFGSRSKLSEKLKAQLLGLLVELKPNNCQQNYLALLNNNTFDLFRWGLVGLHQNDIELLNSQWKKLIESYQGSVAQRHLLKMYLEASREIPKIHKQWLSEIVEKFENDKVLIKEISEAYKWKIPDTVPQLLIWFNNVENEDLKFRIIKSLDGLLKVQHIQFLRNAIEITSVERDLKILKNLLISLESKVNTDKQKDLPIKHKLDHKILGDTYFKQVKQIVALTVFTICISLFIITNNQPNKIFTSNETLSESPMITNKLMNLDKCYAQIISINPVKLHCEDYIISVNNSSKDWQKYWIGETVKVNFSDFKSSKMRSINYKATADLIDVIQLNNDLPFLGKK